MTLISFTVSVIFVMALKVVTIVNRIVKSKNIFNYTYSKFLLDNFYKKVTKSYAFTVMLLGCKLLLLLIAKQRVTVLCIVNRLWFPHLAYILS